MHPTRAAAGYLFLTDGPILLDFGPRTLSNLLQTGVDRHTIRHIIFTHYHADHFSDFIPFFFDAVCHSKFVTVRPGLTIHGPPGTKRLFQTIFRTFPNFSDAPFPVTLKEVKSRSFAIGDTRVTPWPMTHSDQQICLGYRLEYQGRSATFFRGCRRFPSSGFALPECRPGYFGLFVSVLTTRRSPYACGGVRESRSGSRGEAIGSLAFL